MRTVVLSASLLLAACTEAVDSPDGLLLLVGTEPAAFGSLPVGLELSRVVPVTNVGSDPLEVTATITLGDDVFFVDDGSDLELPRQQAGEIDLRFAPLTEGPFAGTLHLETNDPTQPSVDIALSGAGIPAVRTGGCNEYFSYCADVDSLVRYILVECFDDGGRYEPRIVDCPGACVSYEPPGGPPDEGDAICEGEEG